MDLKEFGNSINKILNERLSSPFYGSLIVSWLIINWEVIYLTLFVDSKEIVGNKIDFIIKNYSDVSNLVWYPLLSTVLLVSVVPFITYGAYWLSLFFNDLRKKRKIKVEKSQVLTVEQSLQIRAEIQNQKVAFNNLLDDKNNEMRLLELEIKALKEQLIQESEETSKTTIKNSMDNEKTDKNFNKLEVELINKLNNTNFRDFFKKLNYSIQYEKGFYASDEENSDFISFLIAYNIIESTGEKDRDGIRYDYTEKGKMYLRYYFTK